MKRIIIVSILLFSIIRLEAQNDSLSVLKIRPILDACISMRDAVADGDLTQVNRVKQVLQQNGVRYFSELERMDSVQVSLNGHVVFNDIFAECMMDGKDAHDMAEMIDDIASKRNRGQTFDGSLLTKTSVVEAGGSAHFEFSSKGVQELAVVAEQGGMITLKIHVTNRHGLDRRYDDTRDVKSGRPHRWVSFVLPSNCRNVVHLEVINCGKNDCSFVVISN